MTANELLLWMSARTSGSWQQFRGAVEDLRLEDSANGEGPEEAPAEKSGFPIYQHLRFSLQRLGHAEFFARGDHEWRVTPPSLSVCPTSRGAIGVLAGGRSDSLMGRVLQTQRFERLSFPNCPDQFRMVADDAGEVLRVGAALGLAVQEEAPLSILAALPSVDSQDARRRSRFPHGDEWRIEQWDPADQKWHASSRGAAQRSRALLRFSQKFQTLVFSCDHGIAYRSPTQVGKYFVLRKPRRQVIRYDRDQELLQVPPSCRPPLLVERALILCSGAPPAWNSAFGKPMLAYAGVPCDVARAAASILGQELA